MSPPILPWTSPGALAALAVTASGGGAMARPLRPLAALDLPSLYVHYASLVDLVLYLMLFNGIAQAALAGRLEGKGGRLTAAAVGTALALALAGLSAATGFSLMSLGSVAVVVLLGLVGLVIYRTLRRLQVTGVVAGAGVMLLLSLGIEAGAPVLAAELSVAFPILDAATGLALLVLLWKALSAVVPKGMAGKTRELAEKLDKPPARKARVSQSSGKMGEDQAETSHLQEELRREKPEITHRLRGIVRRETKESRAILRELEVVRKIVEEGGHGARDRHHIAEALRSIPPHQHRLRTLLEEVRELDQRLGRFDLGMLRELREAFEKFPAAQRPVIRRLVLKERQKIRSEERIARIEAFAKTYDTNSAKCFTTAAELILKNELRGALEWIAAAERYETECLRALERTHALERMLRRITRLEFGQLRRAA